MKKIISIIAILVVVAAAVTAWFYFAGRTTLNSEKGETRQGETKESGNFAGQLKDMVMRNVPLKCTFADVEGNSGVGYVKSKKYYGEVTGDGKTSYVIMVDNCMWSWSLEEKQGVKMCFDVEEGEDLWKDWEGTDEGAKMNTPQGNYNCRPATVSDSLFNPPQDIEFMDMDELMNFGEEMEEKVTEMMGSEE